MWNARDPDRFVVGVILPWIGYGTDVGASLWFPDGGLSWQPAALERLDRTLADFYTTKDKRFAHPKAGIIMLLLPHINPIFQAEQAADRGIDALPLWGAALTKKLRETFLDTRRVELETFAEFFPHAGSRVELDGSVKDRFGQPVAKITTALHPATRRAAELLRDEGERVLVAAGAKIERPPRDPEVYWFLQAGTARMAAKASDGVVGPVGSSMAPLSRRSRMTRSGRKFSRCSRRITRSRSTSLS